MKNQEGTTTIFEGQRWKKRPRYFLINNNRTIITDNFVPLLNK